MATVAKDMIEEVESEIKVYLLVLGMGRTSYYFSHFISGCIKMWIVLFILMLPVACALKVSYRMLKCLNYWFQFTSALTMIVLVLLFAIAIVAYSLLWATLFSKPGVCMTVGSKQILKKSN
jgi:hypothetical protein